MSDHCDGWNICCGVVCFTCLFLFALPCCFVLNECVFPSVLVSECQAFDIDPKTTRNIQVCGLVGLRLLTMPRSDNRSLSLFPPA